jgi:DNA repair exonuclease SbcCD ATPase subunit
MTFEEIEQKAGDLFVAYKAAVTESKRVHDLLDENTATLSSYEERMRIYNAAKPVIDDIVQRFSRRALDHLEKLLTFGLRKIFTDHEYSLSIITADKRGNKCAELILEEGGYQYPLKDSSVAGGILVTVGFLIQCFYVSNLPVRKIVFLDEAFTQISTAYLENFMAFVSELTKQIDIIVVLITHDKRFIPYGNRVYNVKDGVYTLEQNKVSEA